MVQSKMTARRNVNIMAQEEKVRNSMLQSNMTAYRNVEVIAQ